MFPWTCVSVFSWPIRGFLWNPRKELTLVVVLGSLPTSCMKKKKGKEEDERRKTKDDDDEEEE